MTLIHRLSLVRRPLAAAAAAALTFTLAGLSATPAAADTPGQCTFPGDRKSVV